MVISMYIFFFICIFQDKYRTRYRTLEPRGGRRVKVNKHRRRRRRRRRKRRRRKRRRRRGEKGDNLQYRKRDLSDLVISPLRSVRVFFIQLLPKLTVLLLLLLFFLLLFLRLLLLLLLQVSRESKGGR